MLSRGKKKLRLKLKPAYLIIFIFCIIITTGATATCIINYIKNIFSTADAGIENPGILAAIENKEWFQEINMDYIELDEKNKIKINYLVLDEMSLYLVVDFESQEDISEYTDVFFTDLKITNEKGEIICDLTRTINSEEISRVNDKLIEKDKHNMKELIFIYTKEIPSSKTLNISFSKVKLANHIGDMKEHSKKVDFQIDLIDKFINREVSNYTSLAKEIEKAVITETGFYAITSAEDFKKKKAKLIDENGKTYACQTFSLTYDNKMKTYKTMIVSDFDNKENNKIKLIIDNKKYELNKKT